MHSTPPPSDVKKGRLAVLERRQSFTPTATPFRLVDSSRRQSSSSASRFRNVVDGSESGPVYAPLCESILHGQAAKHLQIAEAGSLDCVLRELWENNTKEKDVDSTIEKAKRQHLLLDNPVKAHARVEKNKGKRSSKHFSFRRLKKVGTFSLAKEFQRYTLYLPLHEMWKEYARNVILGCNDAMLQSRLLTIDLHGAEMGVVSKNNDTRGMMIRESKNTFGIITPANKFQVVPKSGSVFTFQLDNIQILLFGNNLSLRSSTTVEQQPKAKAKPIIHV